MLVIQWGRCSKCLWTFQTLDQAWAAHLVRNKVAHAGSDFILTKKLAQETVTQYKMVFEELGVV
ncbi:MAG: hypothetical protein R3B69_01740 [Candidatus Paceibacterota bacterium]